MSGALTRYWFLSGHQAEYEHWLAVSTDRGIRVPDLVRARALTGLSLCFLGEPKSRSETGLKLADEAFALYRKNGDLWGQAHARRHMGLHLKNLGRKVEALKVFLDALDLYIRDGSESGQALTLWCLAFFTPGELPGRVTHAKRLHWVLTASRLFRQTGNSWGMTVAEDSLIDRSKDIPASPATLPELKAAEDELREWLLLARERADNLHTRELWLALARTALKVEDRPVLAECLLGLKRTTRDRATPEYEVRLLGAYLHFRALDRHSERNGAVLQLYLDRRFESPVDEARWNTYLEHGQRMSLEQAVGYAISR